MIYRFILSPDAKEGIRSARLWYLQHDINLPLRFEAELKSTLSRIALYPNQFQLISGQVRRARMKRFPYLIYFTPTARSIYVVNILHQRRAQYSE